MKDSDSGIDDNLDAVKTFLARIETTSSHVAGSMVGAAVASTFPADEKTMTPAESTQALRRLVGREFRARLSEVSVAETQTRVFLIDLPQVELTVNQAIQVGVGNRLDLKNALAQVTDAWRNVEVDANQLRGFLNFVYNGNFNTAPEP